MTPLQKAQIVRLFQKNSKHMQNNSNSVALAIGDGANDVSMIQEAKVGIGIMGLEGSQAELASDYAIPKFRFLKRLLFVHGRACLYRDAHCILFSLYKNTLITVGMITYTFYSGYSGMSFMDSWLLAMHSLFFCALQPLLIGIVDKDVDDELAETIPQLYPALSREVMYFSVPYILKFCSDALVEGFAFYFVVLYTCGNQEDLFTNGPTGCIEDYGFVFFTMITLIADLRVSVLVSYYMILFLLANVGELIILPVGELVYTEMHNLAGSNWSLYVGRELYGQGKFYLFLFVAVGIFVVYSLSTNLYIQLFRPWVNAPFCRARHQQLAVSSVV
ncbi:hypothetical protein AGDE_15153 [Angomonas deanei]|uniref:Phospholipid-translocating P-type ATPase C-terminal, putative n=1 Tax=Angomonas deanei TaxID=59799 RepID=A0A7G2CN95_9TRYP|nr:hypothetical protein AGDE_15153 [Angomonas deanei]CAD2220391.1 Phospholipid-translocating P-type ATPase C-terminal, putative [Angomonas deanei]|eukprot:EPY19609.1 hypothetical protein AGDE_15153 [Angomonas deanei]